MPRFGVFQTPDDNSLQVLCLGLVFGYRKITRPQKRHFKGDRCDATGSVRREQFPFVSAASQCWVAKAVLQAISL